MHSEKINSKFFVERAKRYISVIAMPEEELFPIEENKEIQMNLRNLDNKTKNKKSKNKNKIKLFFKKFFIKIIQLNSDINNKSIKILLSFKIIYLKHRFFRLSECYTKSFIFSIRKLIKESGRTCLNISESS